MEECPGELLQGLREREELPPGAVSLLVPLDGVMMRMNAEAAEGTATDAGWREVSCGVVTLVDAGGKCWRADAEALNWLAPSPDLKPSARTTWSGRWRHVLRHDPKGVGRVTDALRHLLRKGKGADDARRELAFLRSNRRRMRYADAVAAGGAIGSGTVESANRVPVTSRMKRPGQRRGRDGGQGVLTFRALRPGTGRAGPPPEPQRRLQAPAMRQRNIMRSKDEPYGNHSLGPPTACGGTNHLLDYGNDPEACRPIRPRHYVSARIGH